MTVTVDQSYINQFSDNMHILLRPEGSLRSILPVEIASGEKHFFERLGAFTASEVVGRLETTDLQDAAHSRRMATVRRYHAGTTLDDIDKFKLLIDPTSEYTVGLAKAHMKQFDEIVLADIVGTAATGKDGSGSTALPSAQKIAHGTSGMTVAKFNQALRILQADEVDIDDGLVLIVNSIGIEGLLGDSTNQLTSFDFQSRKVMADGKLPQFRGVEILHSERAAHITQDTTYRAILMSKNAVKVAMAHDLKIETAKRADLNFAYQVSTYMMYGAVRMEEKRIVEIAHQGA